MLKWLKPCGLNVKFTASSQFRICEIGSARACSNEPGYRRVNRVNHERASVKQLMSNQQNHICEAMHMSPFSNKRLSAPYS